MKWIWRILGLGLLAAIVLDAIRYLKAEPATQIGLSPAGPPAAIREIIPVYNANGGLLPGLADLVHKEFFTASYPCNLCYQTYGTFTMKEEWKAYLDGLPQKKTFLHKDDYRRLYAEDSLALPAILASDGSRTWVLIDAPTLNEVNSLQGLIQLLNQRLSR